MLRRTKGAERAATGRPVCVLLAGLLGGCLAHASEPAPSVDVPTVIARGAESYGPVSPYVTPKLRDLPQVAAWRPGEPLREIPRRVYPQPGGERVASGVGDPDPLLELQRQRAPTLNLGVNVPGIAFSGAVPPDTVGDVGPNHYVQAVNASRIAVFDKNGQMLPGYPIDLDGLAPVGHACSNGSGDPIVLYDRLADRWFLQEFTGNNWLCIYISQTPDPTGAYFFYGFLPPVFPDYPHYGVFPQAYFAGTNESGSLETTYAFDRQNMLAGQPATMQRLAVVPAMPGYGFQVLTPADLDGANPPPPGAHGIFMRHFDDEAHTGSPNPSTDLLQMFEMAVDWTTPANTTVTQLPSITIADFNSWFINYSTFFSIPQSGTTTRLDPIREAIMNRLVYRNFDTHEALVGNFVTNRNPATTGSAVSSGIRWFELRRVGGPGNPWTLHQEGTFAGDTNSTTAQFFMGGIAMDGAGNIGLGYSKTDVGATVVHPSIGVTGRLATDAPGTMTVETTAVAGVQPSTQGGGRWGDYANMSIDPVDDCTFWYTNEYMPGSSWGTRLVSFAFQECIAGPTVSLPTPAASVCALTDPDPQFAIEIGATGGWNHTVELSASGLPPATSADFSINNALPDFTSTLTIADVHLSESGAYAIGITATGNDTPSSVRHAELQLELSIAEPEAPVLQAPADGASAELLRPTLSWLAADDAIEYLVEIATDPGFASLAYSATVAGTSHQVAAPLEQATQYFWRVSAANICGATPSAIRSFGTVAVSCTLVESSHVPLRIPFPSGTAGVTNSTLTVSAEQGGFIDQLRVRGLRGTHPNMGDLDFRLISPAGTDVMIMDRRCGTADDFNLNLDDDAAPGPWPCPPTDGGSYRPFSPLAAFQNEDSTGQWTLRVTDNAAGFVGQLQGWGIETCVQFHPDLLPAFTSTPLLSATVDLPYSYPVTASAPAGDGALVITVVGTLPDWLDLEDLGNGDAILSGTPSTNDLGVHPITLRVTNGPGAATQSFTITVGEVNEAPAFASEPVLEADRGVAYLYAVAATDPNLGDTLTITAVGGLPAWLTLADHGDGTASLAGTPGFDDLGAHDVMLQVSDGALTDQQAFTITVSDVNEAPSFTSQPLTVATIGADYRYDITATDPNPGAVLAITSLDALPDWLELVDHGDGTATLSGAPAEGDEGAFAIGLVVSDGEADDLQAFVLSVRGAALFHDGFEGTAR